MKKYLLLILFIILVSILAIIRINPNFKNFRNKFINFEKQLVLKNQILKKMINLMKRQNSQ